MILPHFYSDPMGHSIIGTTELPEIPSTGGLAMTTAHQDVSFWEMMEHEPGDYLDFHPVDSNRFVIVLSGQVDLTVSNGDIMRFGRGEMLSLADISGQGHQMRFVGLEPCQMLSIAMPGGFK
jgi:quercetin dioxygenase-like cupin family protein